MATLVAGAQFVGRFFGWHSPRGAQAFQDLDTNPMDRVAQHFSWLVRQERKRPIALFVDDLDRCPAADVVELLESVQTLVRDAGDERGERNDVLSPCVVVAGDGAWIRNAFEEHYREFAGQIAEPGRPLGYLFLAKIFQLTLPVPRIGPVRQAAYFRELLGLADPDGADPATSLGRPSTPPRPGWRPPPTTTPSSGCWPTCPSRCGRRWPRRPSAARPRRCSPRRPSTGSPASPSCCPTTPGR